MKGLKEFIEDLAKDNKLREKFKNLKDVKEIVKLAKKEGYEFTEDEYMDKQMENVSGGMIINGQPISAKANKDSSVFELLQPKGNGAFDLVTITLDKKGQRTFDVRSATLDDCQRLIDS